MQTIFSMLEYVPRVVRMSFLYFLVIFVHIFIIFSIIISFMGGHELNSSLKDKRVKEVTQLYEFQVGKIIRPESDVDITNAINSSEGKISIGGGRYSQGGQVAFRNSLHFDMRSFNKIINFDKEAKEITVQAGITWRDIQEVIDKENLSIQIMQTYSNFTVGGSMSVNAHGRYVGKGPLISSIKQFSLIKANGEKLIASRKKNSDIFYGAIGGYGGLGVISEVTLFLDPNTKVERKVKKMPITDYKDHFYENIINNPNIVFTNADIYPPNYEEVLDISWYTTDKNLTHKDRLISKDREYPLQPILVDLVSGSSLGKWIREYFFDPIYYSSERVVWRNWEASYDVKELEPASRDETTYVLREYFVPAKNFDAFYPKMKKVFNENDVNIINVSIRHANKDEGSLLAWAKEESFAFVVYYQQEKTLAAKKAVEKWTKEIIDAVLSVGGTYYLPYQPHATPEQFKKAYPRFDKFVALKKTLDPLNRFTNNLWDKYYPDNNTLINSKLDKIKQYYRGEEQTFLTIPEWYLVFNPKEYADFLESGSNPSDFPFLTSLDEYWRLYDIVTYLTKNAYQKNDEYMTMLQVIGVSTSIEYLIKSLYENTIGRFTAFTMNDKGTEEDKIIKQAHRAYSDLIYHKAWYEFDFAFWLGQIWSKPDFFGSNMIRKFERKIFFSLEFLVKTLYAKLIEFGAKTAYEESDNFIYAITTDSEEFPNEVKVIAQDNDLALIAIPRWGPFSILVPKMIDKGIRFQEISGNDEIVITGLFKNKLSDELTTIKLFSSRVVSDEKLKRYAFLVPITKLHEYIKFIKESGELEHIFDY